MCCIARASSKWSLTTYPDSRSAPSVKRPETFEEPVEADPGAREVHPASAAGARALGLDGRVAG